MYDSNNKVHKILKKYNQEHIIKYFNEENKEELTKQILNIDFEEITELYNQAKETKKININNIEPINATNPQKMVKEKIIEYKAIGKETIEKGKLAVAIMAGGQGTRLRTQRPKR